MKVLVIYDSLFGNTEKIAKSIAKNLKQKVNIKLLRIDAVKESDLESASVIIIGSPTQGGRATTKLQDFINNLPEKHLKGISVLVFDTRYSKDEHGTALKLLMKTIGFAAEKIARDLKSKGANIVAVEGFLVKEKDGPLKNGEEKRAIEWARTYIKNS